LEELLEETRVCDVMNLRNNGLISIPTEATVAEALEILSSNRVLSAPIGDKDINKWIGFVDTFDILCYVLERYTENREISAHGPQLHTWCKDIHKLEDRGNEVAKHKVRYITDLSKRDPFFCLSENTNLPNLLSVFRKGVHRVGVINDKGTLVGIVTQSNVAKFMARNINYYEPTAATSLEHVKLGQKEVLVTVNSECRAIHAFHHMKVNGVSSVAVVDKQGVLLSSLSTSDLKGLKQQNFGSLLMPVLDFIKQQVYHGRRIPPPITVVPSATVEACVLKLAATEVHRLWVVQDLQIRKLIGVVSLTDLMSLLDPRLYIHSTE